jgi:subtilisin
MRLGVVSLLALLLVATSAQASEQVVMTAPSADPAGVARSVGATPDRVFDALGGFSADLNAHQVDALAHNPHVQTIEPSVSMTTQGQGLPTGVNRVNAEPGGNQGSGIAVAILDTGIDLDHPDLHVSGSSSPVNGTNCLTPGARADDDNGHGTEVAGVVGAHNNTFGVIGVAAKAKLYAVKAAGSDGHGTTALFTCALNYVDANSPAKGGEIKVANISSTAVGSDDNNCGLTNNDSLHQAVCRVVNDGVTVVAAAGNDGTDFANLRPASYDQVITATALSDYDGEPCGLATGFADADDTPASFTNWTATERSVHTLMAPGQNILSTNIGGTYVTRSGTSLAAPHIAGSAALYIFRHPGATPAAVYSGLRSVAEPPGNNINGECTGLGYGFSHITTGSPNNSERVVRDDTLR